MFNENIHITTTAVVTTASVVVVGVLVTAWWQRKKKDYVPEKWRRVGELAELSIYPLKSGAALPLDAAECTDIGVQTTNQNATKLRDRFFIVVSEAGFMRTAKQHPKLYFIKVSQSEDGTVTFRGPEAKELTIRIPNGTPEKKNFFKMWMDEPVQSVDCGDEAADWMHSYLDLKEDDKVRLGFHQESHIPRRDFNKKPWDTFRKHYRKLRRFDSGAYSDMAPYMLVNESSVKDLKQRIPSGEHPVKPSWFRPNFVVRGADALDEDNWHFIKIGDSAVFENFKPCLRCILTTVDPETAVKDPNMQPLKTLRGYRLVSDPKLQELEGSLSPMMGCYMGLRQPGTVRVGDPVYVDDRGR